MVSLSFSIQFSFSRFSERQHQVLGDLVGFSTEMMSVPIFTSYLDEIPIGLRRILTTTGSEGSSYPAEQVRVPAEWRIIGESY